MTESSKSETTPGTAENPFDARIAELESLAVLDTAAAIARMLNDSDLYWQVFPLFREQTFAKICRLKESLAANDAEKCRLVTHSIKSSAASVGAGRLRAVAAAMEDASAAGDLGFVERHVNLVEQLYSAAVEFAKEQFGK